MDELSEKVKQKLEKHDDLEFEKMVDVLIQSEGLGKELVEAWQQDYEPPKMFRLVGSVILCGRCGAMINRGAIDRHREWHSKLSLSKWIDQAAILHLMMRLDILESSVAAGRAVRKNE